MANRKEDERNEKIIRNLLKISDNRRCINCNSLGPQYVCINFWTFVCTACSGIHREFTHRVKSVSMAKFTPQEVSALQKGGNAQAKGIYFKEWDPQHHSLPDSSKVERLRDFIKHVYVERRFTGEKSSDKPPRGRMGEADDSLENRNGSRSPAYENSSRYGDKPSPGRGSNDRDFRNCYDERRSPGFDRISPARTEIVNDWRREDRFNSGKNSDDSRVSDGSSKFEGRSPDRQSDSDISSPPIVRPVREILGDNVSPLRIIEPPKVNGGRGADGFIHTQRTASSNSLPSSNGNPTETKSDTLGSLIDFDAIPDPPAAVPQPQPTGSSQSVVQPTTSSSSDNWASFDFPSETKKTQVPPMDTLDSLFSGLLVPAPGSHSTISPPVSTPAESPFGVGAFGVVQTNNSSFLTGNAPPSAHLASPLPSSGMNPSVVAGNEGQKQTMPPQQYSGLSGSGVQSMSQLWGSSVAPVGQGALGIPAGQPLHAVARPGVEVAPEVKPTGRQALPVDLFAPSYSYSVRAPAWQAGPPHGFSYNTPYNPVMPMQGYPQPSKSSNPFDVGNDLPQVHAPTFPSLTSLHGALPNVAAPTNPSHVSQPWMPPPAQSFASPMPPRAFMGNQMPSNLFPGQWMNNEGAGLGSMNQNQQFRGVFPPPTTQNTSSTIGGNPFG